MEVSETDTLNAVTGSGRTEERERKRERERERERGREREGGRLQVTTRIFKLIHILCRVKSSELFPTVLVALHLYTPSLPSVTVSSDLLTPVRMLMPSPGTIPMPSYSHNTVGGGFPVNRQEKVTFAPGWSGTRVLWSVMTIGNPAKHDSNRHWGRDLILLMLTSSWIRTERAHVILCTVT